MQADLASVRYYLQEPPPGYAILISGKWGVGKSYRWTHFCGELGELGKTPITLSVAGLSTYDDLESALFGASIEDLGSDVLREATTIIGRALLRCIKVDPKDIKLRAEFRSGSTVVCLDDIERFAGDFRTLFGFIVNVIDRGQVHCVMIADEDQAHERFKEDYAKYKERIVGKTVRLQPNLEGFCNWVVSGLADRAVRDLLQNLSGVIIEVLNDRDVHNLRTVRLVITDLAAILSATRPAADANLRPLLTALTFCALAISKGANATSSVAATFRSPHQVGQLTILNSRQGESGKRDRTGNGLAEAADLVQDLGFGNDIFDWPVSQELANWILGRQVDFDVLASDFRLRQEAVEQVSAALRVLATLNHYRDGTDAEIQGAISEARQLFSDVVERDLSTIWQIFSAMSWLSEVGIFATSRADWAVEMLAYLEKYDGRESSLVQFSRDLFRQTDAIDEPVFDRISELSDRARDTELAGEREAALQYVLRGDGTAPDLVSSNSMFHGADPQDIWKRLSAEGLPAATRLHAIFYKASRISNAASYLQSAAGFYRHLAALITDGVPDRSPRTIADAEFLALADRIVKFAEQLDPTVRAESD